MEARDSGPKIRPLPIDDLDVDAPQHSPIEPKRRWAPLVVIAVGAVAFGVIASGLGPSDRTAVGGQTTAPPATIADTPQSTTTTTAPLQYTLRDLLPFAEEGIRLVALSSTSARVGDWAPDAESPTYNSNIAQPRAAAFNADGNRVAIDVTTSRGSAVIIDDVAAGNPTYLRDATSAVWHPAEPDLLAWTEAGDAETTIIRVGDLAGNTAAGLTALFEFSVDGDHLLRAWGDWGFATEADGFTFVIDPDGGETRFAEGSLFDANADGVLLLAAMDTESPPFLLYPDGSTFELPGLDVGASDFRITTDGEWVLAITLQADGHTSILARTVNSRSTRLTSVEQVSRIVGTMHDDRILIVQEATSNELVFKDWNSGAEFRIPVDSEIGAVFVGASSL